MSATLERTPFVGRTEERAELLRLLGEAAAGRGAIALIGGEAGVGKTRFALEIAAEAERMGFLALVGRSRESDEALPYAPLVDLIARAVRSDGADWFRRELGAEASEFARLVPEMRVRFPDIPPAIELPPEQERRYLFDSLFRVLVRAARAVPILIVIDDLHLADVSSLALLEYVSERIGAVRALLVATYRDEDVRADHPIARTLQTMTPRPERVTLNRLSSEEVAVMLGALGGGSPPTPVVAVINGGTDGNPFFVEEVVKHLKDEGRLFDSGGAWRADIRIGELEVPGSIRQVIARRLDRLSDETRALLDAAAIAGRSLTVPLLKELGDQEIDAGRALAEAESAGLLFADAEGVVTFSSEMVRQSLEDALTSEHRAMLHGSVVAAIERAHHDRLDEMAAELARHLLASRPEADAAKTARYLEVAGDRALAATAFEEARSHYTAALSLLAADAPSRSGILHRLGMTLTGLGQWDEAMVVWDDALTLAERTGDGDLAGRVCASVVLHLGWAGRWLEVVRFVARGLAAVGQRSPHRALLLAIQGAVLAGAGDHTTGGAMTDTAVALAEGQGDPRLLGWCLLAKSGRLLIGLRVGEALEVGERARELLRASGALYELAALLGPMLIAANLAGRLDRARAIEQELLPLVERLGHHGAMFTLHTQRGFLALAEGPDLTTYESEARAGEALSIAAGLTASLHTGPAQLGLFELLRGRPAEAVRSFRRAIELEPPGALSGSVAGLLLLGLAYGGDAEAVRAEWNARRGSIPIAGRINGIGSWATMLGAVEALAVAGEDAEAAALYPPLLEAADGGAALREWDLRSLQTLAGIAARCAGRLEQAEAHFRRAVADADRVPIRLEQAEARRFYAEMLVARGGPTDAQTARVLLGEALAVYEQAGMPMHEAIARSLLDQTSGARS